MYVSVREVRGRQDQQELLILNLFYIDKEIATLIHRKQQETQRTHEELAEMDFILTTHGLKRSFNLFSFQKK